MTMSIHFVTQDSRSHDSGLCEKNLNLLAHAQTLELDIGSECGGHGICGKDRIRVPEEFRHQFSAVTDEERSHLGPKLLAEGWRLGCQCFPEKSDLDVELR